MTTGHATGFPIAPGRFAGASGISREHGGNPDIHEILNTLEGWVMIRGIVDTPLDLPSDADDGQMYAVRNAAGPGSPPALYIFDEDALLWRNITNTGLPANHALTHQDGQPDAINLQNLLGTPAFPFGTHVLTVGPGCRFTTIADALIYADTLVGPVGILLAPKYYNEDVILRRDHTHFNGLAGGLGGVIVKSMTVSDCTLASIANFSDPLHADKGDPTKLVRDVGLASIPRTVSFTNVRFARQTNVPAWFSGTDGVWDPTTSKYNHDSSLYSFRALGAPVAGTTFLEDVCAFIGCVTDTAAGAVPNAPKGFLFVRSGIAVFINALTGDGCQAHNCPNVLCLNSVGFSPLVAFYDALEPECSFGTGSGGFGMLGGQFMGGVYHIGPDGASGFILGSTFMQEFKTEAVSAVGTFCVNVAVMGNLEITNVGPAIQFYLCRHVSPCGGAGAGGFTEDVGYGT